MRTVLETAMARCRKTLKTMMTFWNTTDLHILECTHCRGEEGGGGGAGGGGGGGRGKGGGREEKGERGGGRRG